MDCISEQHIGSTEYDRGWYVKKQDQQKIVTLKLIACGQDANGQIISQWNIDNILVIFPSVQKCCLIRENISIYICETK